MSKEFDDRLDEPQRSLETTLALHGVISAISERISERGETCYNGSFETMIKHRAVYPASVCEGNFILISVDNVMEDAGFKCSEGCEYEIRPVIAKDIWDVVFYSRDDLVGKEMRSIYSIGFDDVGFTSDTFSLSERPIIHSDEYNMDFVYGTGVTDEDIKDIKSRYNQDQK